MQVLVLREACCSQDDQLGPLEATYDLTDGMTVFEFVRTVVRSRFLQFSSTRTTLTGFVGDAPIVKVRATDHGRDFAPVFLVPSEQLLEPLLSTGPVEFRFS